MYYYDSALEKIRSHQQKDWCFKKIFLFFFTIPLHTLYI
jgi:hypothetical protein